MSKENVRCHALRSDLEENAAQDTLVEPKTAQGISNRGWLEWPLGEGAPMSIFLHVCFESYRKQVPRACAHFLD